MKVTDRGVKYPVTPGHEIVGTIEEIGENVSNVSVGDDVLVFPWMGCPECLYVKWKMKIYVMLQNQWDFSKMAAMLLMF